MTLPLWRYFEKESVSHEEAHFDDDNDDGSLTKLIQVNYLEWEGKLLPESAWCSIPFNEVTLPHF